MEGYIKLSRKLFDSKIWQAARAFSECEAWIDLIQSARFEASPTTSRIGCYEVTWGKGQYPASNRFLAKKWGRSEQWVKSFLGKLKRENMITTDNGQGVNVITLVNYEKYNETPPDNPPDNPSKTMSYNELQEFITHLVTQQVTHLSNLQPTSNPNNKKGEENNTPPKKEIPPKGGSKKEKPPYERFKDWMSENTPNVLMLQKGITEQEFLKLKEKYDYGQIIEILQSMENYKDLTKKYVSAYLTFLKWAKKEYGK